MRTINFPTNISEKSKWQLLYNYKKNRTTVVGKIVNFSVYYGFTIDVDGIKAEMSQSDLSYAKDIEPEKYVGQYFVFAIKDINLNDKFLRLSRKLSVANAKAGTILNGFITDIDDNSLMIDVGFMCKVFKYHMRDCYIDNIDKYFDFYKSVTVMLLDDYTKQKFTIASTKESEIWEMYKNTYKENTLVSGIITHINDNGIIIEINNTLSSFIGNNCLPNNVINEIASGTIKIGDTINAAIGKINEKSKTIYCSVNLLEIIKNKEMVEKFNHHSERGYIYEAEVIDITKKYAKVRIEDIEGYIYKDSVSWNDIERISDILYIGQIVEVVYLADDDERLTFGIKQLNPVPYEEPLYDLDLQSLLLQIGIKSKCFIGIAKFYGKYTFVENLYSIGEGQDGKLLVDPYYGYNLRAIVMNPEKIEEGKYYKIKLRNLTPKDKRIERNQLYQFHSIAYEEVNNPYKTDVNLTFEKFTSPAGNVATAHLLAEVGKNMYSSKDRMFFELIQNADDAASANGVLVNVKTLGDYLVVCHNGNSFDKDDFEAITSAANGTKKANENKTGYKGIGFKSVFTDSEKVFIKTGGYQFKFDKNDERFTDFDSFYFCVNRLQTKEEQQQFLRKFNSDRTRFKGVVDIPWQLEPIWIDKFPTELGEDFILSNVGIALKLGEHKIKGDNGYEKAITDIICNPHFMLFLRNTKRIDFNRLSVSKTNQNGIITLKNSFGINRIEYFKREDFEIDVNNDIFEENGIDIRIDIEDQDDVSGKIIEAKFVDTHNQELDNIPKKIAINNSTIISFAIPIGEDKTLKPNTKCDEISMFAFLPTLVKDFRFPFYINANFILDPPRQRILGDNPWNFYLMQTIAKLIVQWSASLNEKKDRNALNVLVPRYFEENSTDTKQLAEHFNTSYKSALKSEAFILNHKGELARQDEIIIDKTGLSEIIGADLFCQLLNTNKCLPSNKIDSKLLEEEIFENIELLRFADVVETITDNGIFNEWFITASDEQKQLLYKWIVDNNNTSSCTDELNLFVKNLPIFQFGEEYNSCGEIEASNLIITTKLLLPIREILSKLDFVSSDNVFDENHPLYEFVEPQDDEKLFNTIKECDFSELTKEERKTLFLALKDFDGVGEAKIKTISLFKNINGDFKPLDEMVAYRDCVSEWLYSYVICKDDNHKELEKYLISQEDEFKSIIQEHYEDIDASLAELYNNYKGKWPGSFTRQIIDKHEIDNNILAIIEESDTETKKYFLNSIKKLELHSTSTYKKDSCEYRVLQLALSIYEDPTVFSQKIYFDEKCIKEFSVSDEVICDFVQNGEKKKVKMSLAKLLPQYQNQSDSIEKIKALFEIKKDLDKFFVAKPMLLYQIVKGLEAIDYLNLKPGLWPNDKNGNAYQYLFYVYYYREVKGYTSSYVISIQLENESQKFIEDMMDFLFNNRISIEKSPFTYRVKNYFLNKHFASDYNLEKEQLLSTIELWADDDEKKKYLTENGMRTSKCYAIQFRKLFLENKPIDFIEKLSEPDLKYGIEFISRACESEIPFVGTNQKYVLLQLKNKKCCNLLDNWNDKRIKENSDEWDSKEYNEWIKEHYPHIFIYSGTLPRQLSYDGKILLNYDDSEYDYYYDKQTKQLYLCNSRRIEDILFEVAKDGKSDLGLDEYRELCLKDKVVFTQEEKVEFDSLKNEKDKIRRALQKRGLNYDDLLRGIDTDDSSKEDIVKISNGTPSPLSADERKEAQKEAQRKLQELYPNWEYPDGFGEGDIYSTFKVIRENGSFMSVVLKSHKLPKEPLKINSTEWDYLMNDAKLFIYTGGEIEKLDPKYLIENQSKIVLSFSTENLDIEERITAFSDSLHYFKELSFDFESFHLSEKAQSIEGIYNITEGKQNSTSDNDL